MHASTRNTRDTHTHEKKEKKAKTLLGTHLGRDTVPNTKHTPDSPVPTDPTLNPLCVYLFTHNHILDSIVVAQHFAHS